MLFLSATVGYLLTRQGWEHTRRGICTDSSRKKRFTPHMFTVLVFFWCTTEVLQEQKQIFYFHPLCVTDMRLHCKMHNVRIIKYMTKETFPRTYFRQLSWVPVAKPSSYSTILCKIATNFLPSLMTGSDSYHADLHAKKSLHILFYATPRIRFQFRRKLILNQRQYLVQTEHLHHYKECFAFHFTRNSLGLATTSK